MNLWWLILLCAVGGAAVGAIDRYESRRCMERCAAGRAVSDCQEICR